ncbi:glycosyltransferase family 39 protein [Myxococcus landrumensis]|uniref:Glycosyltransferase family 39 protein n=2 Tax=Myxococcus landrumensis TaxID=2813577 RepID=A0ABX7NHG4_9BACT|nr:glycosyltransferase family 39 protein [Myxococcus landrumus]
MVSSARWKRLSPGWPGLLVLCFVLGFTQWRIADVNLYVWQADAWLRGRWDIAQSVRDVAIHDGKLWVPFPPFPSVLLLPLVKVLGPENVSVRAVAVLLTVLCGWALWRLLSRLEVEPSPRAWLTAAFIMGTGFWSCVVYSHGIWFFAHVVAATFLMLAVEESLGRGRAWLVGLYVGLAFLSRQLIVYSVIFLVAVLWRRAAEAGRRRQVLQVAGVLGVFGLCALVYLASNAVRFGDPFETGYQFIPLTEFLDARVAKYGLFHPAYVPFNFIHLFLEGPHFNFVPPLQLQPMGMDGFGTSLTIASPFIFLALAARGAGTSVPVRAAWVSIVLAVAHMLMYYNNGWVQVNTQRFTLDFLPVMMVLVALGVKRWPAGPWKPLVAWAVGLNVFVIAVLPHLSRALSKL